MLVQLKVCGCIFMYHYYVLCAECADGDVTLSLECTASPSVRSASGYDVSQVRVP